MAYAKRSDLYLYAVSPGEIVLPAVIASNVDPTTDTIQLAGHGMETGMAIQVSAVSAAYPLPSPLGSRVYYAIRDDSESFGLALTAADALTGVRIDLTDAGKDGNLKFSRSSDGVVDGILEARAQEIASKVSQEYPPEPPYSVELVAINAKLAAHDILSIQGQSSAESLSLRTDAIKDLDRYAAGHRIRDARAGTFTNAASGGSPANRPRHHEVIP